MMIMIMILSDVNKRKIEVKDDGEQSSESEDDGFGKADIHLVFYDLVWRSIS